MKAGKNKHSVIFWQKSAPVVDDGGGIIPGAETVFWITNAEIGKVKTLNNRRDQEAYETDLMELMQFKLRFRPDKVVTKNMQIQYGGQRFTIQNIEDVKELRKEILIIAKGRE